jgi:hypothetical protein
MTRLYHNAQPSNQGRQGYQLSPDGIGFVKVSEAQVSVKEKFFLRRKASYKAKSSDWRFSRASKGPNQEEQHNGMPVVRTR